MPSILLNVMLKLSSNNFASGHLLICSALSFQKLLFLTDPFVPSLYVDHKLKKKICIVFYELFCLILNSCVS